MEEQQRSYYAIIPANVRYDKDLAPNAKLLYGEITALCNEKGYCWASNQYFAELYGVSVLSIKRWVNSLVTKGYVYRTLTHKPNSKEVDKRILSIDGGIKIDTTSVQKCYDPSIKNDTSSSIKNDTDNNTSINNTFNNKKDVYTHKHKFGEYHHVLLTEDEYERLKDLYGGYKQVEEHIKILDEYIETSGKSYKNHSLVLQKWVHDEWTKRNKNNPVKLDSKFYTQENTLSDEDLMKEFNRVREEILRA